MPQSRHRDLRAPQGSHSQSRPRTHLHRTASHSKGNRIMLTLEQQQRSLLAILRSQPAPHRDPWLDKVATSPGLTMIESIALWWQRFQIEWQCRYPSRLMKRLGCFNTYVAEHFREHPAPSSIEELSAQFLSSLHDHGHPLLRAVARLELACIQPKNARTTTIYWDRNPNQVM